MPESEPNLNNPIEAPEGSYNFLKEFSKRHPLNGRALLINAPEVGLEEAGLIVLEEEVCQETGGSCMDLNIAWHKPEVSMGFHAHITDKNQVVDLSAYTYDLDGYRRLPTPDINTMLGVVRRADQSPNQS